MTDPTFLMVLNGLRPAGRPVAADAACERVAADQVAECARIDAPTHTGGDGSNFIARGARAGLAGAVGECAAQGYPAGWPQSSLWALEEWRGSPGHWAILTNPKATRIGLAYATNPTSGRPYAVAVLAGDPPPIPQPPPRPTPEPQPTPAPGWLGQLLAWFRRR